MWILWLLASLGFAGWVAWLFIRGSRQKQLSRRWQHALEDVGKRFEGRTALANLSDGAELRVTVEGRRITLRIRTSPIDPTLSIGSAEVDLVNAQLGSRIYLGWDAIDPPTDIESIPLLESLGAIRADGQFVVRSDNAALATRFLNEGLLDLVDVRREAKARGVEVILRGGYLRVQMNGTQATSHFVERLALVAVRLSERLLELEKGSLLSPAQDSSPKPPN